METTTAIRLKHFLEFTGMTPSQFADACGIARPTFSQLLSGRNKKLSDQVVAPIHKRFPQLSVIWLMFGEGEMLRPSSTPTYGDAPLSSSIIGDIDDTSGFVEDDSSDNQVQKDVASKQLPDTKVLTSDVDKDKDVRTVSVGSGALSGNKNGWTNSGFVRKSRKVVQITVYYDDSTYEVFKAED